MSKTSSATSSIQQSPTPSLDTPALARTMKTAVLSGIGAHPECASLSPATMLLLMTEIEKLKVQNECLRTSLLSLIPPEGEAEFTRGFNEGVEYQKMENIKQGLPFAWAILNRETDTTRFVKDCPSEVLTVEVVHPLFVKAGQTTVN